MMLTTVPVQEFLGNLLQDITLLEEFIECLSAGSFSTAVRFRPLKIPIISFNDSSADTFVLPVVIV